MTPEFKVIANGTNITPQIADRLLGLSVSDAAGIKSDQVEIELDDRDTLIELPAPGALLTVFMGYKETGLALMGVFTADEVTAKGPPDTVTIRGKAADMGGSIKGQKTRAWDDRTIGQIVSTIAGEHGLEPKVATAWRDIVYRHLDQTDESDLNFLIRIARDHDAMVSVKGGALLFIGRGTGETASGQPMPPLVVPRKGALRWSMTLMTRGDFKSVEATWHNPETGVREEVTEGEGSPAKRLRHTYPSEAEARRAAHAKLAEMAREGNTLSVTLIGTPALAAGALIKAVGFRGGVAGLWSLTSARHEIKAGGFTTAIEAEIRQSETE